MLTALSHLRSIGAVLGTPTVSDASVTGCSIDSRTIHSGQLFFAVRGTRTDGHHYVEQALTAGAVGCVVEAGRGFSGDRFLVVPDTLKALQRLAAEARRLWGRRVVCVTGSAGKTTTKDMIAAALGARFRVRKTEGNLNNEYGVPLSLLRLEDGDQAGVFELAMSRAGEIRLLAGLAAPDTAVVTCVAPVHLEYFESVEDIAQAKYELIQALPREGIAVLNADDPRVSRFQYSGRILTFGIEQPAEFHAEQIREGAGTSFRAMGTRFEIHLPGLHNMLNGLAALAAASTFGLSAEEVAGALGTFRAPKMRGETLLWGESTIINDCYNSNPEAALGMLRALEHIPVRGRRIAVLGEMLELGPAGPELHRSVGARAARAADYLVGVRGLAREIVAGAAAAGMPADRRHFVETPQEAAEFLAGLLRPGDVVLFKASRGVKLEQALEALMKVNA